MDQLAIMVSKVVENALTNRGVLPGPPRGREEEDAAGREKMLVSSHVHSKEGGGQREGKKPMEESHTQGDTFDRENKITSRGDRNPSARDAKKHVQTFDKLLKRAEKYVTLEEVKRAKKAQIKSSTVEKKKEPALKWSGPDQPKGGPQRPKSDKFYRFYNDYGHDTNSCYHLKDEIERVIQAGHLKEFVYQDRQGPRGHKRKEHEKKPDDKGKAPQDDNEWSH
ncbi:hypothetical protein ACS0TY_007865 [Phlomoides rotata]